MERVDYEIKVYDNIIEITPKNGVLDNSVYEIRLKNLKEYGGTKTLESKTVKVCTALTPSYTTLDAIYSILDQESFPLTEDIILYHIREASKFADYGCPDRIDPNNIPFHIEQFVKYKAAYECLLRFYVERSTESGKKGTMGDVSFEVQPKATDTSDLLKLLKENIDYWYTAVLGYGVEGRAKPASAVRSRFVIQTSPANDTPPRRSAWDGKNGSSGGRNL
jgi:hypothetical protein